jgi:succinyl-CoA synthetase alpha subunit
MPTTMEPENVKVGTTIILRNGKVGIVVAQRSLPYTRQRCALQVKLKDEGRTVLIADVDEIEQIVPAPSN